MSQRGLSAVKPGTVEGITHVRDAISTCFPQGHISTSSPPPLLDQSTVGGSSATRAATVGTQCHPEPTAHVIDNRSSVDVVDVATSDHVRAHLAVLQDCCARFELLRRQYVALDLPASATNTLAQRSASGSTPSAKAVTPDAVLSARQIASGIMQEAGLALAKASALRPATESSASASQCREFISAVDVADIAVKSSVAILSLTTVLDTHTDDLRHRASTLERWHNAVVRRAAAQATVAALVARDEADGLPADAESVALRTAVAASREINEVFGQIPEGDLGAVSHEHINMLEDAVQRVVDACSEASMAMGRRSALAHTRQLLDELHAKHGSVLARLAAALSRLTASASRPSADCSTADTDFASADLAVSGDAAASIAAACRARLDSEAHVDAEVQAMLRSALDAMGEFEQRVNHLCASASALKVAGGEAALQILHERLYSARALFAQLNLRARLVTGVANAQEIELDALYSAPAVPGTGILSAWKAAESLSYAATRLLNAEQERVSSGTPMGHLPLYAKFTFCSFTLQSLVDVAAGPEGQSMRHFAVVVDAAETAVKLADALVDAASKDHDALLQRWDSALSHRASLIASVKALAARHADYGHLVDAGARALVLAESAAACANQVHADSSPACAVTPARTASLEAAVGTLEDAACNQCDGAATSDYRSAYAPC